MMGSTSPPCSACFGLTSAFAAVGPGARGLDGLAHRRQGRPAGLAGTGRDPADPDRRSARSCRWSCSGCSPSCAGRATAHAGGRRRPDGRRRSRPCRRPTLPPARRSCRIAGLAPERRRGRRRRVARRSTHRRRPIYLTGAAAAGAGRAGVPDPSVEQPHARLLTAGTRLGLEDLGAAGGTFIDGARLLPEHGPRDISQARTIRLGTVELALSRV